jgi:hypothetical protein
MLGFETFSRICNYDQAGSFNEKKFIVGIILDNAGILNFAVKQSVLSGSNTKQFWINNMTACIHIDRYESAS